MADPLNHLENQDPLEDPLLDALERSIENPPGFTDPLAGSDQLYMDEQGRLLDALESSIVDAGMASPSGATIPPDLDVGSKVPEAVSPIDELGDIDLITSAEDIGISEMTNEKYGTFESSPPLPEEGLSRTIPPNPPYLDKLRKKGGGGTGKKGSPPHRRSPSRLKSPVIRSDMKYCQESNEVIDKQQCEDCEKYRHWPEGTGEEPRECWYDWQAHESFLKNLEEENKDGEDV